MVKKSPVVCVFCGSSFGADPRFAAAAKRLGELIAARGLSLVFGGGGVGLMGEVARSVRDGGAPIIGVMPDFLLGAEQPPEWEEELILTSDLQLRKTRMLAEADAFVVLPGGPGTMDEFFEVVTSAQLHVFAKPILVVNIAGYFEPLLALMRHLVAEGFAKPSMLELYTTVETPEAAIETIEERLSLRTPG
jgi:uncharacterized protein (TIGR00730 family)